MRTNRNILEFAKAFAVTAIGGIVIGVPVLLVVLKVADKMISE